MCFLPMGDKGVSGTHPLFPAPSHTGTLHKDKRHNSMLCKYITHYEKSNIKDCLFPLTSLCHSISRLAKWPLQWPCHQALFFAFPPCQMDITAIRHSEEIPLRDQQHCRVLHCIQTKIRCQCS